MVWSFYLELVLNNYTGVKHGLGKKEPILVATLFFMLVFNIQQLSSALLYLPVQVLNGPVVAGPVGTLMNVKQEPLVLATHWSGPGT